MDVSARSKYCSHVSLTALWPMAQRNSCSCQDFPGSASPVVHELHKVLVQPPYRLYASGNWTNINATFRTSRLPKPSGAWCARF